MNSNLPQLQDNNFSNWKFRVDCLLEEKGVKDVTLKEIKPDEFEKLDEKEKTETLKQDSKAKSLIVQCITDRHLEYVKDAKTSFDMMKSLRNIFERKSTLSKLYIRRQLLTLKV